jgi:hypothetical protein
LDTLHVHIATAAIGLFPPLARVSGSTFQTSLSRTLASRNPANFWISTDQFLQHSEHSAMIKMDSPLEQ